VTRLGSTLAALILFGVLAVGCAEGSESLSSGGAGPGGSNAGGTGSGNGPSTSTGSGSTSTGTSTTSTSTSTGTSTTSTSTSTSTSSSSSSSSATSSSSGGMNCGPMEHLCNGVCNGNTPATGCFTSVSCSPCVAPANGTSSCTAAGVCDFSCNFGYNKSGNACVCAQQCCSNADCPAGETCAGGVCSGGGGMCDANDCQAQCFLICFPQMKIGFGTCNGNVCDCVCL
jgi:hypothetical protein